MRFLLGLALLAASPTTAADSHQAAVNRAAAWMAAYASGGKPLNFDAAIVLSLLRQRGGAPDLGAAFEHADARLDSDRGHPMRRFFEPEFRLPPELSQGWTVPTGAAFRVNPDRVVTEALHCADNGFRAETQAYACGPMRDGGGYYTAHGLWALVLASERGCLAPAAAAPCVAELRAELIAAQPILFTPWSTLDIDLFAERLVMLALSGPVPPPHDRGWDILLGLQGMDGSWGTAAPGESPYHRFHATMMAVWALSEQAARETSGLKKYP